MQRGGFALRLLTRHTASTRFTASSSSTRSTTVSPSFRLFQQHQQLVRRQHSTTSVSTYHHGHTHSSTCSSPLCSYRRQVIRHFGITPQPDQETIMAATTLPESNFRLERSVVWVSYKSKNSMSKEGKLMTFRGIQAQALRADHQVRSQAPRLCWQGRD